MLFILLLVELEGRRFGVLGGGLCLKNQVQGEWPGTAVVSCELCSKISLVLRHIRYKLI